MTTAVAIQPVASALHVLVDLVREGDAGDVIDDIIREMNMLLGRALLLRAPPIHFSQYDRIGLRRAIARLKADLRPGGAIDKGRAEIRTLLRTGRLHVSMEARTTLNAFL